MKSISTTVHYKVPTWDYCNISVLGKVGKTNCRFCVKHGKGYVCVMYNMPLSMSDGIMIDKEPRCIKATLGIRQEVRDTPERMEVKPKDIMKYTLKEYSKTYKQLIKEGYPEGLAESLAHKHVLGGE